ncbi:uncharacterized protein TM35_000391100 [Trypanosoma theileri]|uniref:Cilia- and flagella-associated protein 58 central coiled coil domain-containing protein n=1 Tax=Trypanosoma theileri TaxID=67003 RepID=A0A1X0NJT4_9TRYP|nr:uncharacterized protein TM35_000391100 [Trypanosoma theileri]ORC84936.1 hypothetical protein TM35_000391100 [Trypanosoma theileri]
MMNAPSSSEGGSGTTAELPIVSGDLVSDVNTFNEIRQDNRNFEYYERGFQEVLMGLENDEVLDAFRVEYAALHHSFLKSHDGETRLLRKCIELQADIESCVTKLHAAEELTRSDKSTIDNLRAEIEKTQKKCRASKEREVVLKDKVNGLKRELRDIEERAHRPIESSAQEAALQSLIRAHESVLKEKETLEYQLGVARQEHSSTVRRLERLLETKRSRDMELRAVLDAVEEKQEEAEEQKAIRLRKEEELRLTREEITRRVAAVQERQAVIDQLSEENERHGAEIKETLEETARLTDVYQQLSRQLQNVNRTSQVCNEENDALQRRMNELMEELKGKEAAVEAASRAHRRELKLLEAATRRNAAMESRRAEAEAAKTAAREELTLREGELDDLVRAADADERRIAAVARERDILHGNVLNAAAKAQQQSLWLAEQRMEAHHLEHELRSYEEQAQRQNESIYKLTRECAGYEQQMKAAAVQCASVMTEVQGRERQLADALDEVKDVEERLHQQQNLMESMLNERKTYAKHYAQLRNEVTDASRRFKLILAQIKQMQEEVVRRERRLLAEDAVIENLTRQRRGLEGQIAALHLRVDKKNRSVQQYALEVRRLGDVFAEGEDEIGRQRRRFRDVQKERDLLSTQVVDACDTLASLYEKVRVQGALLQHGASLYEERLRTIAQLQHATAQLTQEVQRLRQFTSRLPELRLLVNGASRELGRAQHRARALLAECERPMNLHPDHVLSWSDPDAYALNARVGELNRELVQRSVELAEKEKRIQQEEAAYLSAKAAVARQLGPEMAEQITVYQGNLAKKAGQMRAMLASLKYFREQTELYEERYNELHDTLDALARSYAESRQRESRDPRRNNHGDEGHTQNQLRKSNRGEGQEDQEDEDLQENDVYVGYVAPPRPIGGSEDREKETTP